MSQDPTPDLTNLPLVQWVSVWESESLQNGYRRRTASFAFIDDMDADGSQPPPQASKSQLRMAFLGLFANDDMVQKELVEVTSAYSRSVDAEEVVDHLASWDYWECDRYDLANSASFGIGDVLCEIDGTKIYRLRSPYVEAVLHLCARERLGPSWPRLIHGLVITYLMTKGDPEGSSFEPIVMPRMFGIQEGVIDGYHPVWGINYRGPNGLVPVIAPGVSKRTTLQRLKEYPSIQTYVREHWNELKGRLNEASGYQRRTEVSEISLDQVRWAFHRHILRETTEQISANAGYDVTTIDSAIKDFRRLLDLQPKNAVRCLNHRQRPQPLHGY